MGRGKAGFKKIENIQIKKSILPLSAPHKDVYMVMSSSRVISGTEKHHISHVLTFCSFVAHNAKAGINTKRHLLERMEHHLNALKEFIEESELIDLVNGLIESLQSHAKRSFSDMGYEPEWIYQWLLGNQGKILKLAECYEKKAVFNGVLPLKENLMGRQSNSDPKEVSL